MTRTALLGLSGVLVAASMLLTLFGSRVQYVVLAMNIALWVLLLDDMVRRSGTAAIMRALLEENALLRARLEQDDD